MTRAINPAGSVEKVWADLLVPFEQDTTYTFTIDLSLSSNFHGEYNWVTYYFNNPCILQIFGFNGSCLTVSNLELLWQSEVLTNFEWQTFTVTCTPALNSYARILIRPFFTPPTNFQNSAVLIDNLAPYVEPDPEVEPDPVVEPDPPPPITLANSLFVPNIFTPNGDGRNGTWTITGTNIATLHAMIYDRWGHLVHTCMYPGDAWSGRGGDGDCAAGVYFYVADVVYADGQTENVHGTITLLR